MAAFILGIDGAIIDSMPFHVRSRTGSTPGEDELAAHAQVIACSRDFTAPDARERAARL